MEKGFHEDRKKTFFALIFKKTLGITGTAHKRVLSFENWCHICKLRFVRKFASLKHSFASVQVYAMLKHTHQN